jgi:hypothetical protein
MDNYQEVISRLKFLCKINRGEKINTKQLFVVQDSFITTLTRTFWNQDNRINTIHFIQETINKSFDLLHKYIKSNKSDEKQLAKHLIFDLQKVIKGLLNLQYTYIFDTKFVCDIDTIIENIKARLILYDSNKEQDFEKDLISLQSYDKEDFSIEKDSIEKSLIEPDLIIESELIETELIEKELIEKDLIEKDLICKKIKNKNIKI